MAEEGLLEWGWKHGLRVGEQAARREGGCSRGEHPSATLLSLEFVYCGWILKVIEALPGGSGTLMGCGLLEASLVTEHTFEGVIWTPAPSLS